MPEWISRFLVAASFLVWPPPALADVGDLEGTWMHVGDRYGLVGGYIEQVDISASAEVSVRLFVPPLSEAGCGEGVAGDACDIPRETARGKLMANAMVGLLLVTEREETAPAFPSPPYNSFNQEVWQALRFAGAVPWNYELQGDLLRLSRGAPNAEGRPELLKLYHRVDPQMPADLYDFLIAMSLSIFKAGCAIEAIQADAGTRAEFRRLIAAIAPVVRGGDIAAARELREWMMANPEANDALFPGAEPALPQIRACLEETM